jgi:pectate lyase
VPQRGCDRRRAPALAVHSLVCALACALPAVGGACSAKLQPWRTIAGGTDGAGDPPASSDLLPTVCPDQLLGYATMAPVTGDEDAGSLAAGTTGGSAPGAGPPVVVDASDADALDEVIAYAKMDAPVTIQINGMISFPPPDGTSVQEVRVSSNKTLVGGNATSGFWGGGLNLTKVSNVIIRNLIIGQPSGTDSTDNVDAIHIETSHNVWVDHCDLSSDGPDATTNSFDGLVDITDQSDWVTVSWTRFHDHDDTGIIGRADTDTADVGLLHVTYHHEWFRNVVAGPRARFGTVHVSNTYFEEVSLYGVASTMHAEVLVENNVFDDVALNAATSTPAGAGPVTTMLSTSAEPGYVDLAGNVMTGNDGQNNVPSSALSSWAPPYEASTYQPRYTPDSATSVPAIVETCSGVGRITPPVAP